MQITKLEVSWSEAEHMSKIQDLENKGWTVNRSSKEIYVESHSITCGGVIAEHAIMDDRILYARIRHIDGNVSDGTLVVSYVSNEGRALLGNDENVVATLRRLWASKAGDNPGVSR